MSVEQFVIVEGTVLHIEDERAYEWHLKPRLPEGVAYHRVSLLSEAIEVIGYREIRGFIVDLWIHGQSSAELIRRIHKERPEAPLVILTKYPEDLALKGLVGEGLIEAGDIFDKTQIDDNALEKLIDRFQPKAPPRAVRLPAGMDLRLLHLVEKARGGLLSRATASIRPGEIPVIARVNDLEAWKSLPGLRTGIEIPRSSGKEWVVTGRLQADRAEFVYQQPFVLSLQAGQLLTPQLVPTLKEVQADTIADLLGDAEVGRGVVIGFIDFGCDFAHPNFRHNEGRGGTRVLSLWHQDATNSKGAVGFGALYERSDLNAALASANPYKDYFVWPGSHGTHVMDIAAGGGAGTGVQGIAPASDLVFVDLSAKALPWGAEALQRSLTDSVHLLEAIAHIFEQAGDRPCVLNLSIGTELGAHDGTSAVELALDDLVAAAPSRAIVVAASNSYELGIHASGVIEPNGYFDLSFKFAEGQCLILDLWYRSKDQFAAEIFSPAGQSFGQVELGTSRSWPDPKAELSMKLVHIARHEDNRDNRIQCFLSTSSPAGVWTLRLHGIEVQDGRFHAWIEGDGGTTPHSFLSPDPAHTLGCLACGHESIAVGAYNVYDDLKPCTFSSAGPTRDSRQKPDLSAPGERIFAARSRSLDKTIAMGGTSMAAPVVTGIVAVLLSEAEGLGIRLRSQDIREILRRVARLGPPERVWHSRYGWGRIDAQGAILALHALSSPPLEAEASEIDP